LENIRNKTIKGFLWNFIDSFGTYFIRFCFSIAIARVLSPNDFGLIGMIAIFVGIANWISNGGMIEALIQKKDVNNIDYSTVFYFNIAISFALFIILYFSSDMISEFFNEKLLSSIIKVISLSFVFSSFSIVHLSILIRKMDFKYQAITNFIAAIISGGIGLFIALKGHGVWALVMQTIMSSFIRSLMLWVLIHWRPNLIFNIKSFKELFKFGKYILFQGLLEAIFSNMYAPIIGKQYNSTLTGYYTRSKRFHKLFVTQLSIVFSKVLFPAFCNIQEDKDKIVSSYYKVLSLMTYLIYPVILVLIFSAKPFYMFFLTEKWAQAIPFTQLLYLDGLFFPFYILNLNLYNVRGKSKLFFILDIIKKTLLLISIVLTVKLGINEIIIGYLSCSIFSTYLSTILLRKNYKITFKNQVIALLPIIGLNIVLAVVLYLITILNVSYFMMMLLQIITVILIYYLLSKIFKIKAYSYIIDMLKPHIPERIVKYL
jgi:O-antigen/teichoic acid export membrane protein